MLLFWGLLSLVQVCFLPGLIIIRLFKGKILGWWEQLAFVFAFSLMANFLLVFALASVGLYIRWLVLLIFAAELILAAWLYRQSIFLSLEELSAKAVSTFKAKSPLLVEGRNKSEAAWPQLLRTVLYYAFLLLAVASLAWIMRVLYENRITVFSVWDTVVSWNPWAVEWFGNHIPETTRRYGQLIPTNWSLTYMFMGSTQIQFFAKAIAPLFTLFILLLTVLLGLQFRSYGFFIGAVLIQLMFKKFLGVHVYSGYVDTAVAFFSFASIYALIKANFEETWEAKRTYLLIGALMAAGAFCTKQPGLYVLLAYPVIAYFTVVRTKPDLTRQDVLEALVYPMAIALAIAGPWYVYTEFNIWFGSNKTEFAWILEEVHHGRGLLERTVLAIQALGKYIGLFVASLLFVPLMKPVFRWILLVIVIPYSLAWALYASYSERNLAIAFPLIAIVGGVGIESFVEFAQDQLARIRLGKLPVVLIAILAALVAFTGTLAIPDSKLIDVQTTLQKDILIRGINKDLYKYFEATEDYQPILAGYPLEYLPGFAQLVVSDSYEEYASYKRHLEEHPEIGYLLVPGTADEQILSEISEKIDSGEYEFILDTNKYILVKIDSSK